MKITDGEIIDSAQPAHNEPPPLCYSSTWLSMNVLVLDPKTVCVEKSEIYQAEQLDKLGMEVVPVELRELMHLEVDYIVVQQMFIEKVN